MPSSAELLPFLYAAAAEPLGIYLLCPDPNLLRMRLSGVRNQHGDPLLAKLQFRVAPPGDVIGCGPADALWVVNPPT